ncbi:MAG: hypothetical protein HUU50_08995 [Candidatus Brocadiae bacterium]|nr:hypothetical protein [Candidatus Brocadiia bacterium]
MKYPILFLCIFYLCLTILKSEDGIINGKDDVLFGNALARWGYYDLANTISDRLANAKSLPYEQRNAGKELRCSIIQIQGEREEDPFKKSQLFRDAIECYKELLPSLQGMKKFYMQLEIGDLLVSQARTLVSQAEESEDSQKSSLFQKAAPFLDEAEKEFAALKKSTNHAGRQLDPKNEDKKEKERAEYAGIRYQAWLGYARALFFQSKIGKKNYLDKCLKELESYIWDYEGRIGAFYAMILRGMVMQSKKKYQDANDSFDNVIKALQDRYVVTIDSKNEGNLHTGGVSSAVRKILLDKGYDLNKSATMRVLEKNTRWLIEGNIRLLILKDQNGLNIYEVITSETAHSLRLQACYYKIQTLLEQKDSAKAVALVKEFKQYLKEIHDIDLEEKEFGQAILLEMGKAYIAQKEYGLALEIAQKVAQKKNYWGFIARSLLAKWGKLDPNALQNIQNAYLVATALWDKDQYQEAILSFLKILEYVKSKEDMERYGLDALEKLGQAFWLLSLYHESGNCYQMIAQKYSKYDKIVKIGTQEQRVNIAAKASYWAYRAYLQSYDINQDQEDKNLSAKMLEHLTQNWPESSYALNRVYDQAKEKEKAAELAKGQEAQNLYRIAAHAYQQVKPQADMYEPSFVYIGKCYYKAAEAALKASRNSDEENASQNPLPREIQQDYDSALKQLHQYHSYTKRNSIPELDIARQARRKESLAQSYFYLGQIYLRLGDKIKAMENFQMLLKEHADQGEMLSGALYYMIRIQISQGEIYGAEKLLQEMEKRYGTKSGNETIQKYQSFSYYLLGKEYGKKAQEISKKVQEEKEEEKKSELQKDLLSLYQKEADAFYQWVSYKENPDLGVQEWIATKMALFAGNLVQQSQEEKAVEYYQKAFPLFQNCLANFKEEEKREQIELKLVQCALMLKNAEMAIKIFYPLFHKDLDKRLKQREKEMGPRGTLIPSTQKEDAVFLDYISQILVDLAEQNSFKDTADLYFFLLEKAHIDLKTDLKNFSQENRHLQSMLEKYKTYLETAYWIEGKIWSDQSKKETQEEFDKKLKQKNRPKEQKELLAEYEKKCLSLIEERFPIKADRKKKEFALSEEEMVKRIKRICLYRGYDFVSRLVDNLPRYTNPQIRFGFYDNTAWWDAKYRQVYILYLQENRSLAKNLIEILRIQQKKLGGPKYETKFLQLLDKIR